MKPPIQLSKWLQKTKTKTKLQDLLWQVNRYQLHISQINPCLPQPYLVQILVASGYDASLTFYN